MTEPPEESVTEREREEREREEREHDERVPLTPGLVILGLVAVALGLFAAVVMSAQSLAR